MSACVCVCVSACVCLCVGVCVSSCVSACVCLRAFLVIMFVRAYLHAVRLQLGETAAEGIAASPILPNPPLQPLPPPLLLLLHHFLLRCCGAAPPSLAAQTIKHIAADEHAQGSSHN